MALHVRRYTAEDEDALFAFREKLFPDGHKSLDRAHFRWKFLKHPYANEMPFFIMEDNGKVVGTQGYWPFLLRIGTERLTCGHLVDFNVDDAYRGLPTLRLFKAVCSCSQLNFGAYLSPDARRFFSAAHWVDISGNLKNYFIFLRNPGKAGLAGTGKYLCLQMRNTLRHKRILLQGRAYDLTVENRLPVDIEVLLSRYDEHRHLCFIKEKKFLSWRYEQAERNRYCFASLYREGVLQSCVIYNIAHDADVTRCFIMDLFHRPGDRHAIRVLLVKLIRHLKERTDVTVLQSSALPILGDVFTSCGFSNYDSQMGFMCSSNYANLLTGVDSPWRFNFNLGDTDFL